MATVEDSTAWMLESDFSKVLLLSSSGLAYMAMLAYTYLHGCKLFPTLEKDSSKAYKFVRMCFQCTGGGIIVPLLINAIPVTLGKDAYPICIFISFLLHEYLPFLREVVQESSIFKIALIFLYECQRASVVYKLTTAAAASIPASDFSFAVFGPIFCGAIGGCGGAFLPMNKGLDPIKKNGLGQPMYTALIAAACLHLFLATSLSEGIAEAGKKAQLCMAVYFITDNISNAFPKGFNLSLSVPPAQKNKAD